MKPFVYTALFMSLLVTGCTRDDRYGTKAKTGEANREIHKDAEEAKAKVKEGWMETKKEVKQGVDEIKKGIDQAADKTKDAGDRAHRR